MSGRCIQLVSPGHVLMFVLVWWIVIAIAALVVETPQYVLGFCQYVALFVYLRASTFTWRFV